MAEGVDQRRERELVLAPNEFAYIADETKGNVDVYVGPNKTSLAATDQPVIFNTRSKRFERVQLQQAIQTTAIAPEGWYVVLKNPARDREHPKSGARASMPQLDTGRKINVPGPCSFALWPGQMGKVLQGHHIRSNQYLLVRVYDEEAARQNWKSSIIKPKVDDSKTDGTEEAPSPVLAAVPDLTMGKMLIIRGTDVSFYIPPTGIEVVPDEAGKLVRDAVTLERLEYCLLLDEDGNKRYVRGPDVVFPEPTEVFVLRTPKSTAEHETPRPTRKFKAIELRETSGIYVKVIADYVDEAGKEHKVGEELFITGKENTIYFPREEHAIIKYGDQEVHYATAIPTGEGRYVLNSRTGDIRLVKGPIMFLPDPREEVLTRRVLDLKTCELLYPGNAEALAVNAQLAGIDAQSTQLELARVRAGAVGAAAPLAAGVAVATAALNDSALASYVSNQPEARGLGGVNARGFTGDGFNRKGQYTEPRTITLNTKYSGAVTTSIYTGYAMMLVRKSGERKVVQGPITVMLEYDETPQVLTLSTGKPKNTDNLFRTVFLRTHANMVTDVITVETKDFCQLEVKLIYRVNFEGEPTRWFSVENYVKFLCDHMRSRVRAAIRKFGVQEFYLNSEAILRDVILGKAEEGSKRKGTRFDENGMHVYDVEVLTVTHKNKDIETALIGSQREVITHTLALETARRKLSFTTENEGIKQQTAEAEARTKEAKLQLDAHLLEQQIEFDRETFAVEGERAQARLKLRRDEEQGATDVTRIQLAREKEQEEQQLEFKRQEQALQAKMLMEEAQAVINKASAITPDLIAALTAFSERDLLGKVSESMSPLAIIGGGKKSVQQILGEMLAGSPLAKHLTSVSNGTAKPDVTAVSRS